ncbi:hypothetical protein [Massilia sp. METH4]|uniref:hypothetical protein n=1 Tax=Massilia sp. METH4 TaxID=3123041 RepID=UPI0030D1DF91
MIKKHRLALVGGYHSNVSGSAASPAFPGPWGLLSRIKKALGWDLSPLTRAVAAPGMEAAGPAPDEEKFFSTEAEATAFASTMLGKGFHAEVVHDPYDFSWSVDVYAPRVPDQPRER